jgi:RNA-directed DNA polymerase
VCGKTRSGRFKLKRSTDSKRMRAKLKALRVETRRRRHQPIPDQGRWLASVLRGHDQYYAVPDNAEALSAFRHHLLRHWYKALTRRSQRTKETWERMYRLQRRWFPPVRILHPWPDDRFVANTQGRSPVR